MASIPTFSSYSLLLKPNNTNTLFPNPNSSSSSCTLSPTSLFRIKLTLQRPISITNFSATSETVPFNLPTDPNPQSDELQKKPNPNPNPKWSARAIRSYAMAELEVRKIKYPKVGTESLLMGILIEGTSRAAKFLRANGITFLKKALDWAVNEKLKSDLGEEGETNVTHLLLGIWSQEESAGRKVLAALGFNDEKAEEIAKTAASGDIDWSFKKKTILG
ncbi:chaperone protein ClpC, chloroplastic [Trifolium repens]|nr:chaperone protein ClpC, chloroplastic [Trifolium repens]